MTFAMQNMKIAIAVAVTFAGSQVKALSKPRRWGDRRAEEMEEKLDRLQKQTAANTAPCLLRRLLAS